MLLDLCPKVLSPRSAKILSGFCQAMLDPCGGHMQGSKPQSFSSNPIPAFQNKPMWKPQQPLWTLIQANRWEPQLLRVEPYVEPCGTWTFQSGTVMWNLVEPELFRMEPLCGNLWNLNFEQWNLSRPELHSVEPVKTFTCRFGIPRPTSLPEPSIFPLPLVFIAP